MNQERGKKKIDSEREYSDYLTLLNVRIPAFTLEARDLVPALNLLPTLEFALFSLDVYFRVFASALVSGVTFSLMPDTKLHTLQKNIHSGATAGQKEGVIVSNISD